MDRYIASFLVYRYGVKAEKLDYVYKTRCKKNLIKCYDPDYDPGEKKRRLTKEELIDLLSQNRKEHEVDDYTKKLKVIDRNCSIFMLFVFTVGLSISYFNYVVN